MAYKQFSPQDVVEGGTGLTTITDHAVMVGSGTSAVTPVTVGTNGQALIGSTGADPVFATIASSDSLLTLTGGAGTLDITAQNAVSASAALTDNLVIRGDGGSRGVQTSTVSITDNGEMTNGSQPAFSAYLATQDANETGDGTIFYFGDTDVGTALTEVIDQNSDFTGGASGGATFTAPVTGQYYLAMDLTVGGLTSSHTAFEMRLDTSNRNHDLFICSGASVRNSNNVLTCSGSTLADMDAADTAKWLVYVANGTKVVDVLSSTEGVNTTVSGNLVC